ncbi:hypothetical protein DFH09DRAFT_1328201 [Mycena vulgaris]|nr:hypothetical protein DFH09DRAFT_1328201 [Mycena vulgaris]
MTRLSQTSLTVLASAPTSSQMNKVLLGVFVLTRWLAAIANAEKMYLEALNSPSIMEQYVPSIDASSSGPTATRIYRRH